MEQGKTYIVRMEFEVTASSKEEAIQYFVQDVKTCAAEGMLNPVVVPIAEEPIRFQTPEELETFVQTASTEALVEMILSQGNVYLECGVAFGEQFDQFNLLSIVDRSHYLSDAIEQMDSEDLLSILEKYLF